MTTEAQAVELIEQQFVSAWPAASGAVPFALDNEDNLPLQGLDTFAQLTIQHTASQQITLGGSGSRRWLRRGVIYVRVWSPVDVGRGPIAALCDAARVVFEGKSLGSGPQEPVTIDAGQTREAGSDSRWVMVACTFGFRYYETR